MPNSGALRSARPTFPVGPDTVFLSAWRRRELLAGLVRRDIAGRYRGSFFGGLWSFAQPLLMLSIYTLVFGVILPSRWSRGGSTAEFALTFFAGLIVFNFFAECVVRAPTLVLGNPNFVKKVVFPLEILPWMSVVSALFQLLVSLTAWLLFCLAIRGVPPWTIVLLPLTLLPLVLLTLGVSWTLASLGVFVRDAGQVVGMVCTALMFLSPVFYDAAAVPERWRWLLDLNPLTYPVEQARHLLLDGQVPDAAALGLQLGAGALVAWAGLAWFQRTRGGFADVI